MQLSLSSLKTHNISQTLSSPTTKQPLNRWAPSLNLRKMSLNSRECNLRMREGIKCGKNSSLVVHLEKELEEIEKQGKEWRGLAKGGIVELLECLEKEAIMGDDEGREPNDYNRRAQIFDKSSKVFQALKELDAAVVEPAD